MLGAAAAAVLTWASSGASAATYEFTLEGFSLFGSGVIEADESPDGLDVKSITGSLNFDSINHSISQSLLFLQPDNKLYPAGHRLVSRSGISFVAESTASKWYFNINNNTNGVNLYALYGLNSVFGNENTPGFNRSYGVTFSINKIMAVPGPVAGTGVPALLAFGGVVWARRRKAAAAA
jgi:hypothetical protein